MSSKGKDTNVSENEKEKGKKNAKKAKAVDFSGLVAKAELWDKGVTDGKTPMQAASKVKVLSEILLGNDC